MKDAVLFVSSLDNEGSGRGILILKGYKTQKKFTKLKKLNKNHKNVHIIANVSRFTCFYILVTENHTYEQSIVTVSNCKFD